MDAESRSAGRRALADHEDVGAVLEDVHRRLRAGDENAALGCLATMDSWDQAPAELQDLAISTVARRLDERFRYESTQVYEVIMDRRRCTRCGNIAKSEEDPGGLCVPNIGDWPGCLGCNDEPRADHRCSFCHGPMPRMRYAHRIGAFLHRRSLAIFHLIPGDPGGFQVRYQARVRQGVEELSQPIKPFLLARSQHRRVDEYLLQEGPWLKDMSEVHEPQLPFTVGGIFRPSSKRYASHGLRFPTIDEWRQAAWGRGTGWMESLDSSKYDPFFWGDDVDSEFGAFDGRLLAPELFAIRGVTNPLGLALMFGNVWETLAPLSSCLAAGFSFACRRSLMDRTTSRHCIMRLGHGFDHRATLNFDDPSVGLRFAASIPGL